MSKPNEFNWTTQERIKSHEEYLRGSRSVAASLNWATAESATPTPDEEAPDVLPTDVEFPDTLMDCPQDSDDAVDHSDPTKPHDTSAGFAYATNWDALLDTAGIPTDGTPPDPLAAQQQQQAIEDQAARQALMTGKDTGTAQPGITSPLSPPPAPPGAQEKAKQRERAGRGVEGCGDEGPTNPMDPGSKYDWDSFSTTPRL